MFFQMRIVLAIAFLAIVVTARGPTFPIGNGGLAIVHGDAAVREGVKAGLAARGGASDQIFSSVSLKVVATMKVDASSGPVFPKDDILTIIEEGTTTTILTTTTVSPITITVSPIPLISSISESTSASTVPTQLSEMASTSSLIIAISAFLSSSSTADFTSTVAATRSPYNSATRNSFFNTTTSSTGVNNGTFFYPSTATASSLFSAISIITPTHVYALSNGGYAANVNTLSRNESAYALYMTTSTSTTKTSSSTRTMYTTITIYENTPTATSTTTSYTAGPDTKTSSIQHPISFLNTAYPSLDFSGRDSPAPLQTGLRDYNAAGNGKEEKARKAAKASVFAGIALGVWMVIRMFLH